MKKKRCLSLLLAVCLGVGLFAGFGGQAAATDWGFLEYREEPTVVEKPTFTEEEITVTSGDNTISGTLTMPGNVTGKVPVAILLHGLATSRMWCDDIAWCLADNGIASIRIDFAGTGLSTGAQEDMCVSSETADTLAVLDYVKKQSYTDIDNIFLVGKSMGGVDAMLAAGKRSSDIKAVCLWYPGFGVTDSIQHGFLLGETFDPENLPDSVTAFGYTFGKKFLEEAGSLDLKQVVSAYSGPVKILHGTDDYIVPIESTFAVLEDFQNAELEVVPGGMHGFWGYQEYLALQSMLEFLQEHID